MYLREPHGTLEAAIGLRPRSLQRTRQLGGHQRLGNALPFDTVERCGVFDLLFESLQSERAGVVLWAKPTHVSNFVPYTEIVESQVLAVVLDDLLDNPGAVQDRDPDSVLLCQFVLEVSSCLIGCELAGDAVDARVLTVLLNKTRNVGADFLSPLFLGLRNAVGNLKQWAVFANQS